MFFTVAENKNLPTKISCLKLGLSGNTLWALETSHFVSGGLIFTSRLEATLSQMEIIPVLFLSADTNKYDAPSLDAICLSNLRHYTVQIRALKKE